MRILSLQPNVSLTLEALGCLDQLAGCTRYCVEVIPKLGNAGIPIVHDSWSSNTEEIASIRPDLVIASVPYRQSSLEAIIKAGLPVLALAPHELKDIYGDIRLIGAVAGQPERAAAVIVEMQSAIEATRAKAATVGNRPLVYCEEWGKPLIHSQFWVKELVEAAGGRFLGEPGKMADAGAVLQADPDIMIFAWCGAGDRVPVQRVLAARGWLDTKAARTRRAWCLRDELLNTPAPTLIDGLDELARLIHPEVFGEEVTANNMDSLKISLEG